MVQYITKMDFYQDLYKYFSFDIWLTRSKYTTEQRLSEHLTCCHLTSLISLRLAHESHTIEYGGMIKSQ